MAGRAVLGVTAPVAVGRFLGIPLRRQVTALARPALATALFLVVAREIAPHLPSVSWLTLVPAVAVTALFSFMTGWNEFIQAATFMNREDMYTGPVGLRFFVGGYSQQWGYFAAGSIVAAIPVVLLFLFLQKYLVSGLTAGAVKG